MEALLQQLAAGLANGCVYAGLALALVLVHQSTQHINFAQGEQATLAAYLAWAGMQAGLGWWPAALLAVAASFVLGVLLHVALVRPLMRTPVRAEPLAQVAVFVGLMLLVNAATGALFGHTIKAFPALVDGAPRLSAVLLLAALVAAVWLLLRATRLGLALRAAAIDATAATLVGLPAARLAALGWGLAAAVGAVAGIMVAPLLMLEPQMMGGVLVYAFAAALLGGLSSPVGAVFGGLAVGVAENLLGAYVSGTELKLTVALAVIVGALVLRPQGLFGERARARV